MSENGEDNRPSKRERIKILAWAFWGAAGFLGALAFHMKSPQDAVIFLAAFSAITAGFIALYISN